MGGTQGMRDSGKIYLPKWPLEEERDWVARRDSTSLFPAFADAVDAMVGKPLGEPIICENVPAEIEAALENVDLTGRDLDTFARDWFKDGIIDGISWVIVDYPVIPEGATLAQERAIGARPYLVHIPLTNIVSWYSALENGKQVMKEFRYRETIEIVDKWEIKNTERIRVWRPGEVEVWEERKNGWVMLPELSGKTRKMDGIPIVCFAPGRTGYFTALPPLETLAWLNVTHWQSSSDQRNILHVARVPMRFGKKLNRNATTGDLEIGPQTVLMSEDKDGDFKYVEHTGKAIESGRQDLVDLKEEMRLVAGKMLTRQAGGDKSATEASLEARDGGSKLKAWVWSFQDAVEEALRLMAKWVGKDSGGSVTINTDWDDLPDPSLFTTLLQARQAGQISQETFLWNVQRYGLMAPGRTTEDEGASLDAEGPTSFGTADPFARPAPKAKVVSIRKNSDGSFTGEIAPT
jgi:hypothetical protein